MRCRSLVCCDVCVDGTQCFTYGSRVRSTCGVQRGFDVSYHRDEVEHRQAGVLVYRCRKGRKVAALKLYGLLRDGLSASVRRLQDLFLYDVGVHRSLFFQNRRAELVLVLHAVQDYRHIGVMPTFLRCCSVMTDAFAEIIPTFWPRLRVLTINGT